MSATGEIQAGLVLITRDLCGGEILSDGVVQLRLNVKFLTFC